MLFFNPAITLATMEFDHAFNSSYLVAFTMGLLSSMHCVGMCGSIIGTLTLSLSAEVRNDKKRLLPFVFNYNAGRVTSYTLAGLLLGFVQAALVMSMDETTGYRVLQILSAIVMASAGLYLAGWFPRFAYIEKIGLHFWRLIEPFGRRLIPVKTYSQAYLFGMVWGWLPCSLVYTALALASTAGGVGQSALTMLFFGLGTIPAVMGIGFMTGILTKLSGLQRFRQVIGLLMIALALLAVIPDLNPMRWQHTQEVAK